MEIGRENRGNTIIRLKDNTEHVIPWRGHKDLLYVSPRNVITQDQSQLLNLLKLLQSFFTYIKSLVCMWVSSHTLENDFSS